MKRNWSVPVALAVLALSVLAGCGDSVNTGPFGNGAVTTGAICVPVRSGGVMTDGDEEFKNKGPATATVEKVSLYKPRNLSILAAYLVPITGYTLYGWWPGYPTAARAHQARGIEWSQRQRADGATVRPSPRPRNEVTNLVLVLKLTAKVGTASGIDVWYGESRQEYHWRTGLSIELTTGHC